MIDSVERYLMRNGDGKGRMQLKPPKIKTKIGNAVAKEKEETTVFGSHLGKFFFFFLTSS